MVPVRVNRYGNAAGSSTREDIAEPAVISIGTVSLESKDVGDARFEVRKIVAHWRRQGPEPQYVSGVEGDDAPGGGMFASSSGGMRDNRQFSAAALIFRSMSAKFATTPS